MRIVVISDTHGQHEQLQLPVGDILIHAGDITQQGSLQEIAEFNAYLADVDFKHKIIIAGNHDFCFQETPKQARQLISNAYYLEDEALILDHLKFYGSPWQPFFFNWAFNLERGAEINAKWQMIDVDTDVLITHGPAFGFGDKVCSGQQVGCEDLLDKILDIKPRYHVFGHIHENPGMWNNQDTIFINASICNADYQAKNKVIVFDID